MNGPDLSVCPFVHDGSMDFLHISYHYQVACTADACTIAFGSVPNLSNYINFVIIIITKELTHYVSM